MTNKLFPKRIQLPGNELSGVHHVVYNQAVGVRNLFEVSLLTLLLLCFVAKFITNEITVNIDVEYSRRDRLIPARTMDQSYISPKDHLNFNVSAVRI